MGCLTLADRKTVSDSEIKTIIQSEIQNADGYQGTRVAGERAENLNAYFARPYGNEVEGRSQVVSRDVQQSVEWQMPSYMRIFTSGEDFVSFEPSNANDADKAKQATEYVNYIWASDNHGFRILYEWIKDALISKVGVIKIWWDDTPKTKRERYSGLDDATFAQLVAQPDVKVSEHTKRQEVMPAVPGPDPSQPPIEQEITVHDVVLTRTIDNGRVCIWNVPPEEFLISKEARSIEDARLVGHRRQRTLSDLREDGFDKEKIDYLSSGSDTKNSDIEEVTRNTVEDYNTTDDSAPLNEAMRLVWVTEAYIKIDVDGDGIAEMRKITTAGPGYTILDNEAWEGPRPLVSLTPIIMPHRFWGLCPTDLGKDTQLIKTTIFRQLLDNMYLANNQREEVDASRIIDPDEVLSSAPGRKIRVKPGSGLAINPIVVPNIASNAIEALNYLDQIDEANTGVSQRTQGLSTDTLSNETKAQSQMLMTAAMGKQELIARVFAETGIKDAFRLILKLICMYQDKPRTVKLTGGWVPIDPSSWDPDMDMKASVGLGMGDRDQMLMAAGMVAQTQEKLLPLGFITPENFQNAVELGLNGLGLKGVSRFVTFPQGPAAKQPIKLPPPNQKPGTDPQTQIQLKQIDAKSKVDTATAVANINAQAKVATTQHQNSVEAQRDTQSNSQQMQLDAFKANLDRVTAEVVAHINAAAKIAAAQVTASVSDGADAEAREAAGEAA